MILSGITIYPIKSLRGISLTTTRAEKRGLCHDRRWMIVDENGRFVSQRENARLALVAVAFADDQLQIAAESHGSVRIDNIFEGAPIGVTVWRSEVEALAVSREADQWLTDYLGYPARLVYMPDTSRRETHPDYCRPGDIVSFADGFPILAASQSSLDDLNSRLGEPLPMNRFRPNLIISGCQPFEEDTWPAVTVGEAKFRNAKPCGRCIVTTTNQETAEVGVEPLHTLARFRLFDQQVNFGINWHVDREGTLSVGQEVIAC